MQVGFMQIPGFINSFAILRGCLDIAKTKATDLALKIAIILIKIGFFIKAADTI